MLEYTLKRLQRNSKQQVKKRANSELVWICSKDETENDASYIVVQYSTSNQLS